jgi:hypothetical protein
MYHKLYQDASGPVHPGSKNTQITTALKGPAYGCKELVPLRSTIPCPSAIPRLSAHTSRDRDAALCLKGKECAPCTLAPFWSHRRLRVGKLAVNRTLPFAFQGSKTAVCRASVQGRVYPFHPSFMIDWINNVRRTRDDSFAKLSTVAVFTDMDIRIDVKKKVSTSGRVHYVESFYRYNKDIECWDDSLPFGVSDVRNLMRLQDSVQAFLSSI